MTGTVHRGCGAACRASGTQGRGLGWKKWYTGERAGVMTDIIHRGCGTACRASGTQGRGLGWK